MGDTGGFHSHGGTPNGWLMENPNIKWVDLGYPHEMETSI